MDSLLATWRSLEIFHVWKERDSTSVPAACDALFLVPSIPMHFSRPNSLASFSGRPFWAILVHMASSRLCTTMKLISVRVTEYFILRYTVLSLIALILKTSRSPQYAMHIFEPSSWSSPVPPSERQCGVVERAKLRSQQGSDPNLDYSYWLDGPRLHLYLLQPPRPHWQNKAA